MKMPPVKASGCLLRGVQCRGWSCCLRHCQAGYCDCLPLHRCCSLARSVLVGRRQVLELHLRQAPHHAVVNDFQHLRSTAAQLSMAEV